MAARPFPRRLASLLVGLLASSAAIETDELAQRLKLALWQRAVPECGVEGCSTNAEELPELLARWTVSAPLPLVRLRGGEDGCAMTSCEPPAASLHALRAELGEEFSAALDKNEADHVAECAQSCESFYCGEGAALTAEAVSTRSYSMGSVPPEDFADAFKFPLDLIRVTANRLIEPHEAEEVVALAVSEGMNSNEYKSGKYKLGGDWVKKMPRTLQWFNARLQSKIFPTIAALFPEIVSDASVLRAHSVAILKYNASHPRTDVHVDDGILAMTLALSPRANYTGGGTFFEHLGEGSILPMDQGQCTFRPGSVRHGGHPVRSGERYILGAFLLIADRVEHVRRLQNQGREARNMGNLPKARKMFKWALKINPRCATCLKNWAEAITAQAGEGALPKHLADAAEDKLRRSLELLPQDSDAWYSLARVLSEQGRKEEAISAYYKSLEITSDDADACYNLAVLVGDKGDLDEEKSLLRRALSVKPDFGAAWANLGVALASSGDLEGAEEPFRKAVLFDPNPKNWMNLARLHQHFGRIPEARAAMLEANAMGGV
ncbi:hypothetical protein AB1Y20_010802 [Prymnesium parvum]|uniref:Fe2OG dioxygenase domain-containing protein n=1 Tax=Prymnesium parvum TaxID=97485 RepID=A0AB34IPT6_PRYPA